MKKHILMSVLIAAMLAMTCVACGSTNDNKGDTLKNDVTEKVTVSDTETEVAEEVEPTDIKVDDLAPLADKGVITGVKDITVEEGTDVDLNELVYADTTIVKSVDVDDSAVDYSKAGTYEVIYTITFDGDKLRDYVKDNDMKLDFDIDGDTIIVKTTVTVTVATKEETEAAIASGADNVVTPETKESVAESNKAKANDNATVSKPADKTAGNAGNSNSGNAGGNSNTTAESKPANNSGNNSSTEKPHVHSYNSGVVTVQPTCTTTGTKVYTCTGCGDSYSETIAALGHDPVTRTETVTVKEAWTEDVLEPRYICNGCGASFTDDEDVGVHMILAKRENPDTTCRSYHSDAVKVNTINHPAETETRDYKVCSRCGERL